ncbi:MAG TPA: NAD-dependent epimerase/dehydratase family protein [Rhizomicrobium sp.]|nr:NAD-dependent epimerase/dehydratase family protein [Rhizomicrobium sp.]
MQTVLVTGANGFVGGWCIVALLERGYAVRATLRSLSREPAVRAAVAPASDATGRLSFRAADLTKDDGWDEAVAGCDHVLHVASPLGTAGDPDAFVAPARDGTLRVLAAATRAGVKRVVVTSAAAAARPRKGISDEMIWADPSDPQFDAYRRSMILAERAAWDFKARAQGAHAPFVQSHGAVPVAVRAATAHDHAAAGHEERAHDGESAPRAGLRTAPCARDDRRQR